MPITPARGGSLPPPEIVIPTGLRHFDDYIGGQRPGDCNGLLAVSDVARTAQLIDLAMANARNFYREGVETGTTPKLAVFLSYDEPKRELQKKIWANACRIMHSRLVDFHNWEKLTTQANLLAYEYELAREVGSNGLVPSESERWDLAGVWLNQSFLLVDMSGFGRIPGTGYVDEVVTILERVRQQTRAEIGAVFVDDAERLCTKFINAQEVVPGPLRYCLGSVGLALRQRVAQSFNCIVWVAHGVAGRRYEQRPSALIPHWKARQCESFAEYMPICGCLGAPDPVTKCTVLHWSKVRYCDNRGRPTPVVKIDTDFFRVIDLTNRQVTDPRTQAFIDCVNSPRS